MNAARSLPRATRSQRARGCAYRRLGTQAFELLENRCLLAFTVVGSDVFATGGLRLVADFSQPVNPASVQNTDLTVDGAPAVSANVVDADTVEFFLPALAAGAHSAAIASGAIQDSLGDGLVAFSKPFTIAGAPQLAVKHNPRLQPGNAPLTGFAGSELDRVDLLWQTIPAGAGTQDSFTVEYRPVGSTTWQAASLNAAINTGIEGRVVRSATITGLAWNSNFEYRVRHLRADVIVGQYQSTFHTRLAAGDNSAFTFVTYGDSASGAATGFRQVQGRINQLNPAFAVLLGDNVYNVGSHPESDSRFDPVVNPEAAAWLAGHIDYLGLGNHDVGTSSGLPSEQNFSVPVPVAGVTAPAAPPASERAEHSFSWDYGNVHFLTFDTNSLSNAARLDGLLKWAVADLNASTARWKIVYGHHPVAGVPDKLENPGGNYYHQVVNRLKAAGVDLFMTGHSHTYGWTYPLTGQINGIATFADHGADDHFHAGEGLPQLVSGLGGVDIRPGSFSQFPFVAEGFTSETSVPARLGFSKIDVTQNKLTVTYVAADNGAAIDSFQIEKEPVVTTTFQQGVNGYAGTVDTFLQQNLPSTNNGGAASLKVDSDDPDGTGLDNQTLLRFENLFGNGPGQIPAAATLRSATLQLEVTNGSTSNMNVHRMLSAWSAGDTWNSLSSGIQTNGIEAAAAPDTSSGQSQPGQLSFNVLASLQAWQANPSANRGWAILPTGNDGVDFNASEGAIKPKLIVSYLPNDAPVAANDNAFANAGVPVALSVLANDTDPNSDALTIESATQPAHGVTAVNAGKTVTYTPAAGYAGADSFSYKVSDGRGGTATATVRLLVAKTVTFQQGANGYVGAVDTFVQQNSPAANNSAVASLNVDSDDPDGTGLDTQALVRFNSIFGSGQGLIPTGATLRAAALRLQVTDPSTNAMNVHRMLAGWAGSSTWNSLSGGVQTDGVEAVAAPDASASLSQVGQLSLNVLASLKAWQTNPVTNRGWALLPTGGDGVEFQSSEGVTKPKLAVTYIPVGNTPPTITRITDRTIKEDLSTAALPFTVGDAQTAAGSLTVTASSSNTALVPNANLLLGGSGANRTVKVTPAANRFGSTVIKLTVTDAGGATAVDTFLVTVTPVNDAPVAQNDSAGATGRTPVTIAVLANDSDVEASPLTVSLVASPANGVAVVNAAGTVTYTANAGFSGTDSFTYRANDGAANSNIAKVTVTVAPGAAVFVVNSAAGNTLQGQTTGSRLTLTAPTAHVCALPGYADLPASNQAPSQPEQRDAHDAALLSVLAEIDEFLDTFLSPYSLRPRV